MYQTTNTEAKNGRVTIGSVEQNIFIPTLHSKPDLNVKAVSAMFRKSPLCITSLPVGDPNFKDEGKTIIGAHEDTVSLLN